MSGIHENTMMFIKEFHLLAHLGGHHSEFSLIRHHFKIAVFSGRFFEQQVPGQVPSEHSDLEAPLLFSTPVKDVFSLNGCGKLYSTSPMCNIGSDLPPCFLSKRTICGITMIFITACLYFSGDPL